MPIFCVLIQNCTYYNHFRLEFEWHLDKFESFFPHNIKPILRIRDLLVRVFQHHLLLPCTHSRWTRMKYRPRSIALLGMAFVYVGLLIAQWLDLRLPFWMTSYLEDLLCLPLLLSCTLLLMRKLKRLTALHAGHLLFTVVYVAVLFEGILPELSARYTADPHDVICYALGGLIFYIVQPHLIRTLTHHNETT